MLFAGRSHFFCKGVQRTCKMLAIPVDGALRIGERDNAGQSAEPRVKLGAEKDADRNVKLVFAALPKGRRRTETVDNNARCFFFAVQGDKAVLPTEHPKGFCFVFALVGARKSFTPEARFGREGGVFYAVEPKVDDFSEIVHGDKIIILIIPDEVPGADRVYFSRMRLDKLFIAVVFVIGSSFS